MLISLCFREEKIIQDCVWVMDVAVADEQNEETDSEPRRECSFIPSPILLMMMMIVSLTA